MVAKGNGVQIARMRRSLPESDATAVPVKLKKKVVAVRSDTTTHSPTHDASRNEADTGVSPLKTGLKLERLSGDHHQRHEHIIDKLHEEGGAHASSTPLVAIAPAKPGTMLPKDMIMAKYRVKPDAPKFLLMLYEILQHESNQVIRWTDDGLALQILDQATVTEKVLPKYFNHTNFHSFQRQLNYFGFRKWTKSKTDICTFSHPYFRRNQPELMHLIKRKKATRRAGTAEQPELVYPADSYAGANADGGSTTSVGPSGAPKKLLPLSPSGKRRLTQEHNEDRDPRPFLESSNMKVATSDGVQCTSAHQMHSNGGEPQSIASNGFLAPNVVLANAISPASGGAKKKAKTTNSGKSFNQPELVPSGPMPTSILTEPVMTGTVNIAPANFAKGGLPNLDLVRNRLIYRQPSGGTSGSIPGFSTSFPIPPTMNSQHSSSAESIPQNVPPPAQQSSSSAPPSESSSSMFSNSFSDPVDILLRIKKSRAMSQDNTLVQSPQQNQGQAEGFASLQNFLLSQSMYTNRLESQLKLAMEENDALRQLVDAKQREVEALLNERKMIQNENQVLTEDKNKLFEINRDLLSKLFPQ